MVKEIPLTHGLVALVDDDWFDMLRLVPWHAAQCGRNTYAKRCVSKNGRQATEFMHRLITDAPSDMQVHHINSNSLDNRRENLRICSEEQNKLSKRQRLKPKMNEGRYKGTTWCKITHRWRAQISVAGKMVQLGRFATEAEAAATYNAAAIEHYGEFALLNILETEINPKQKETQ